MKKTFDPALSYVHVGDPWESLANCIIIQCVQDMRLYYKRLYKRPYKKNEFIEIGKCYKFLRSDYCQSLTGVDMPTVADRLEEEMEEHKLMHALLSMIDKNESLIASGDLPDEEMKKRKSDTRLLKQVIYKAGYRKDYEKIMEGWRKQEYEGQ